MPAPGTWVEVVCAPPCLVHAALHARSSVLLPLDPQLMRISLATWEAMWKVAEPQDEMSLSLITAWKGPTAVHIPLFQTEEPARLSHVWAILIFGCIFYSSEYLKVLRFLRNIMRLFVKIWTNWCVPKQTLAHKITNLKLRCHCRLDSTR